MPGGYLPVILSCLTVHPPSQTVPWRRQTIGDSMFMKTNCSRERSRGFNTKRPGKGNEVLQTFNWPCAEHQAPSRSGAGGSGEIGTAPRFVSRHRLLTRS